jgi:NAD+ synthase
MRRASAARFTAAAAGRGKLDVDQMPLMESDPERETGRICSLISRLVSERRAKGLVLGLSGGLDSSVVAALAAEALGPGRVHALLLPERNSSKESIEDARGHAEQLGIQYRIQDLTPALEELGCYGSGASGITRLGAAPRAAVNLFPGLARKGFLANLSGGGGRSFQEFVAFIRIKHRLRMVAVYREAEAGNLVAASCANRTEYETGFFVRYGDDAGDVAPIKHLYKTQVFRLGRHLQVPERILEKKPSPDLFAGMKDEEIMGMRYAELDSILWCMAQGLKDGEIEERTGSSGKSIAYVREIVALSARFREPPADLME